MQKVRVYLSGAMEAYSGTTKAEEWRAYCKDYFKVFSDSFVVFSPTDYYMYGANYHKSDYEIFRFDLMQTKKSDVVLVNLNDVRKSIGTCIEVYEAYRSEIPVIGFLDEDIPHERLAVTIHPWVYCCVDRIETGAGSLDRCLNYIKNYYG